VALICDVDFRHQQFIELPLLGASVVAARQCRRRSSADAIFISVRVPDRLTRSEAGKNDLLVFRRIALRRDVLTVLKSAPETSVHR